MRHARLAPGWRAAPLPSGRRSRWVALNGFSSCHPPPQDLSWRNQLLQVIPNGKAGVAPVLVKHIDGGTVAPRVAVRHGQFNLISSRAYPPMLFDLEGDPLELSNIAGSVEATDAESHLLDLANHAWDLDSLAETVKRDLISRRIVHEGLGQRRREFGTWSRARSSSTRTMCCAATRCRWQSAKNTCPTRGTGNRPPTPSRYRR